MSTLRPTRIAAAVSLIAVGVVGFGAPAVGEPDCGGSSSIDGSSATSTGFCASDQPPRPGEVRATSTRDLWNAYCAEFTRPYLGVYIHSQETELDDGTIETTYTLYEDQVEFLPIWDHPPENASEAQMRGEFAFMLGQGWDPTSVVRHYQVRCTGFEMNWTSGYGAGWVDGGATGDVHFTVKDPVPLETIRDNALAKIQPDPPAVGSAPPTSQAVVSLPTWLWVDTPWVELTDWEREGAVRVDVFARPADVTWTFDDAEVSEYRGAGEVVCDDPGEAWTPADGDADSSCQYLFTYPSAWNADGVFHGSVTVRWVVSWSLNGDDQGEFGEISRTTSFDVDVVEIQTVGVDDPGR